MSYNLKHSAKYVKYARRTGCVKFKNGGKSFSGFQTLDVPLREAEIFQYLVETSNWFLFERNNGILTLTDLYSK